MSEANPETFSQRLTSVVDQCGLSRAAFARRIGVGDTTLKNYMTGETEPGVSELLKIASEGRVLLHWLLTGEGPRDANQVREPGARYSAETEGYTRDYVYAVAVAFNNEMHASKRTMTAERHAKMLVALLHLFRNAKEIEPEAIKMMLEATES